MNSNDRLNKLEHWKVGDKWSTLSTQEITPQNEDVKESRIYYFQVLRRLGSSSWTTIGHSLHMAAKMVKSVTVLLIATRDQKRNETLLNEVTKAAAKLVSLPEGRHVIDHTHC
nr:unnamed protein product [Callosobruchus chinensis]